MSLTIGVGEKEEKKPHHVDDFIDYGTSIVTDERSKNEDYARWVLMHFRMPATLKMAFGKFMKDHKLFCTYEGERYRVIGASRLGDIWLTKKFDKDHGYDKRVMVDDCCDWGENP